MPRLAIIDRAAMNVDQARAYDAAKQSGGPVGGPYYAYIRLPKLFDAAQNLRATLSSGPLSRREQQIVNLVIARHCIQERIATENSSLWVEQPYVAGDFPTFVPALGRGA